MGRVLKNARRITLWSAAATFAGIGVLPLCLMLAASLGSVENYTGPLGNPRTWALFGNSLLLATLTTAAAGLAGVPLGVLFAKTDLRLRTTFAALFALPLLFPPYVLAAGWFEFFGRRSAWLFGLPGAVLVLSSAFLPVVVLLTVTSVRGVDPRLEDAARLSRGWAPVVRSITIPLAMPGILLALLLVFLLSMGEFGAPAFLRFDVFPVASFTQFTAFYNFGAATAAAMPLALVVLLGLAVERRILGGKTFQFGWNSLPDSGRIPLRRARHLAAFLVALLALALLAAPLGALLWRGCGAAALREALGRAGGSALRSVAYSATSATALTFLGFFLAYLIHRRALLCWRAVDGATLFLFTLPGTLIGIGLIGLWNRPATNWIYGTPAILAAGYLAQYAALGTRIMAAGFAQIPIHLEEAAEVGGAAWFRRVALILAPLLRPSILVSWAVTFLFCLRDVTLPLLLAPPGFDTLTARTMTLAANGSPELIAALCVLLMSLSLIPLAVCAAAWKSA